ncbi:MAG: hypothetical protein RL685_2578 [Pseudomonadota bacterium]|jgi:formylglycine-generating enzyme required for sulfatase activity/transposase-like protein
MVTEAPTSRRDDKKLELVERILRGQITLQEACSKHGISGPELKDWMRLYRREARRVLDERVRAALSTQGMELEDLESAEFSGNVETLAVAEVIQTLSLGRKNAEILIEHDGQQSRIWCCEGEVVDAECDRLLGAPAVYRLLMLTRGRVHADCGPVRRPRTINVSTQALLMEAARRADECNQLRPRLGDLRTVYVTSGEAMSPDARASATEFAVLRLIDGHRSLERVLQDSTLPDLETFVHLVDLRERGLMEPRVTPVPPASTRATVAPASSPEEPAELSFVPLAASLGARYEPRWSRHWVWGLALVGASTLSLALGLRYSEGLRSFAHRAGARMATARAGSERSVDTERSAGAERGAGRGTTRDRSGSAPPSAAAPADKTVAGATGAGVSSATLLTTAPSSFACPEAAALLSRPQTRDTAAQTFCLDRSEVSTAAYAQCVGAGSCQAARRESALPDVALRASVRRRAAAALAAQCNSGAAGRGQHPMNCVTFEEAESYCSWRGGRLPTDAEWTLAAEGVQGRAFPWGSDRPSPGLVNACGGECKSWHSSERLQSLFGGQMYDGHDGYAGTAPVGSFPGGGTPEGIVDLIGNVAEWTAGSVEVYDGEEGADTVASRVVRGGAFTSSQAALETPALRLYLSGSERDRSVGFRCAFSLAEAAPPAAPTVNDAVQKKADALQP